MAATSTFTADLIYLLETEFAGTKLTYNGNLFLGPKARIPDIGGPFVSVISSGGIGAAGTHNSPDAPAYEQPTGQILTRAVDYDDADLLIQQLYQFMFAIRNRKINGTFWQRLKPRGEPFDLPPDEKQRPRRAFNIESYKRVSPETS